MTEEKDMYRPIAEHFRDNGYWTLVDEFCLLHERLSASRVDVVAAKWSDSESVDAIAVEAKLVDDSRISALQAMKQAVEYQICFPKVYVATQLGDIGTISDLLNQIGIGLLQLDMAVNPPVLAGKEQTPKTSLIFDRSEYDRLIKDRLIMGLVFRQADILGKFKSGEFRTGGWVAKEREKNVQLNCSFDAETGNVMSGLNLERKEGFRKILNVLDTRELLNMLTSLPDEYKLGLSLDFRPRGQQPIFPEKQANQVTKRELTKIVEDVRKILKKRRKKERPHVWIRRKVWDNKTTLSRSAYEDKIRAVHGELQRILDYLTSPA